MQSNQLFIQSDRVQRHTSRPVAQRIAIDEHELSQRWGLSVKTLRRWRQSGNLGPIFCKMGARVTYLISEVEAYERRVSRHSTFSSVYQ
jgi:hypothetical protein